MNYKAIIVGAGPAGIFAALTLAKRGVSPLLLLEQGKDLPERQNRRGGDILCGWGGAGAFSDGKLTLSSDVGGFLGEYMEADALYELLAETDKTYVAYGAPEKIFGNSCPELDALSDRARLADLELIPARIRHIGTENCKIVLDRLRRFLSNHVEIRTNCGGDKLIAINDKIEGVKLTNGDEVHAPFVVVAPGRSGARWMKQEAESLDLGTKASPVDIGVRVELPSTVLKEITDIAYESKLVYYTKAFDDKVRTFCMNPYGEVVTEKYDGVVTVNGHSYANKRSENTNFAILVSSAFTEPFDDPIGYGFYIARLANLLGKHVIVQRLGDLLSGRRSTQERLRRCLTRPTLKEAVPGDLSFVFPYRHMKSIIEMLEALDRLVPGVCSRHTLLYGVEVKFYSNRIELSNQMETRISNLFAIGDGAGVTRGLLQASASGILAARTIADRASV